jgi:hypothetical protein
MLKCYYTSSSVVVLILSSAWLYSMFLDENYSEVSVYQKITIRICCLKLWRKNVRKYSTDEGYLGEEIYGMFVYHLPRHNPPKWNCYKWDARFGQRMLGKLWQLQRQSKQAFRLYWYSFMRLIWLWSCWFMGYRWAKNVQDIILVLMLQYSIKHASRDSQWNFYVSYVGSSNGYGCNHKDFFSFLSQLCNKSYYS